MLGAVFSALISMQSFADSAEGSTLSRSARLANRRTALRCLASATDYASEKKWAEAESQAALGRSYDATISDLWYISAVAAHGLGQTKAEVLPLVKRAIDYANWVNYNRDSARVLYADILVDTMHFRDVFGVIDSSPFIYSADAEYIRTKAYYCMGDSRSVDKARERIASARQIYPDDMRFPLLFFTFESPDDTNPVVRELAKLFVAQAVQCVSPSPDKDAELEMYASLFASGETRTRLLQSFAARGLSHPLYARVALEDGILSQEEAFRYLVSFADGTLDYSYLADFMPLLSDETVLQMAREYFTAYSGTLVRDTGGDGIPDLKVVYERGRPSSISYDVDQDSVSEWHIDCDFGVPVSGTCTLEGELGTQVYDFSWADRFPYLSTVSCDGGLRTYELVSGSLKWSPVNIVESEPVSAATGVQFFFPEINVQERGMSDALLLGACSSLTIPTRERRDAFIRVTVLNGAMQIADYYSEGKLYARTQFEGDVPALRLVDSDGDGIFETTEYYRLDSEEEGAVFSPEDERTITANIFGSPSNGSRFSLRMIQVDQNADNIADYTEEYMPGGGKISSWDSDEDGRWDVRYVVHPAAEDGTHLEESMFYGVPGTELVTVTMEGGVPVKVKSQNGDFVSELPVKKDAKQSLYWIGEPASSSLAKKALAACNKSGAQGVSVIVADSKHRVLAVRIGSFSFGKIIPEEELSGEETVSEKDDAKTE